MTVFTSMAITMAGISIAISIVRLLTNHSTKYDAALSFTAFALAMASITAVVIGVLVKHPY